MVKSGLEIGFPNLENHYVVKFNQVKAEGVYEIIKIMRPGELLDLSGRNDVQVIKAKLISGKDVIKWQSIS